MMATNMPSSLDPALLRPGRLDRIYKVGYPSKAGRKKTYEGYFGRIKHSVTPPQIERLATMTPYATGASIKDLVNESLIVAMRNGRDFVTWPDVVSARKIKMVGPGENVDYIERERHAIALHEACHAVMAFRVQKGHDIDLATIEKGADFLGFVSPIPMEEMFTDWRSTYESDILVSLASLAGERIFFDNDNSSGVTGDLQNATALALAMEAFWGMGETVGSHLATKTTPARRARANSRTARIATCSRQSSVGGSRPGCNGCSNERRRLLQENRFEVLAVAHALEAYKTITGEDIDAIINGYPGPLVDGRPYHQAKFIEVAEAYHQRVISAHREQGRVDMALPVFAGDVAAAAAYNYGNGDTPSYRNDDTAAPAAAAAPSVRLSAPRTHSSIGGDDPPIVRSVAITSPAMRAWRAHQLGDPFDVLRLDEVDEPVAGPGELLVDIEATGLAYPEVLMCQGKYQGATPIPYTPGGEVAGRVVAVRRRRDHPSNRRPGRDDGRQGARPIERRRGHALSFAVPESVTSVKAVAILTNYGTTWFALHERGALQAGRVVAGARRCGRGRVLRRPARSGRRCTRDRHCRRSGEGRALSTARRSSRDRLPRDARLRRRGARGHERPRRRRLLRPGRRRCLPQVAALHGVERAAPHHRLRRWDRRCAHEPHLVEELLGRRRALGRFAVSRSRLGCRRHAAHLLAMAGAGEIDPLVYPPYPMDQGVAGASGSGRPADLGQSRRRAPFLTRTR